jgi:hypothetical protein
MRQASRDLSDDGGLRITSGMHCGEAAFHLGCGHPGEQATRRLRVE